jgi:hypothetical protein
MPALKWLQERPGTYLLDNAHLIWRSEIFRRVFDMQNQLKQAKPYVVIHREQRVLPFRQILETIPPFHKLSGKVLHHDLRADVRNTLHTTVLVAQRKTDRFTDNGQTGPCCHGRICRKFRMFFKHVHTFSNVIGGPQQIRSSHAERDSGANDVACEIRPSAFDARDVPAC